jgi:hypothetical protein
MLGCNPRICDCEPLVAPASPCGQTGENLTTILTTAPVDVRGCWWTRRGPTPGFSQRDTSAWTSADGRCGVHLSPIVRCPSAAFFATQSWAGWASWARRLVVRSTTDEATLQHHGRWPAHRAQKKLARIQGVFHSHFTPNLSGLVLERETGFEPATDCLGSKCACATWERVGFVRPLKTTSTA